MAVAILELINIQTLAEMAGWNPSIQAASICMYILYSANKKGQHTCPQHTSFIPLFPVLSSCLNIMYHNIYIDII